MSIHVTCPAGHTLKVAADWAGRAGLCPVCKAPIQVPGNREEVGRVEAAAGTATVTTNRSPTFNPARPQAAPPVRTRTHTKPLPPAPPRLTAGAPHKASAEAAALPAVMPASPPTSPPPVTPVSASSLAAAAIDAALAIEDTTHEARSIIRLPAPEPVAAAVVLPPSPPVVCPSDSRNDIVDAAVAPALQQETSVDNPATESEPIAFVHQRSRPRRGYVPDEDKRWTVYYLAAGMAVFSVFCLLPGFRHWNLGDAPDWARAVWLVSILQLAYVAWAVSVPDWSTLWMSMIVFTVVATGYGVAMAVALTTPLDQAVPLDMTDIRRQAPLWCGCVVLLAFLLAYLCGRAAWRWRKTFELVHA